MARHTLEIDRLTDADSLRPIWDAKTAHHKLESAPSPPPPLPPLSPLSRVPRRTHARMQAPSHARAQKDEMPKGIVEVLNSEFVLRLLQSPPEYI